MLDLVGKVKYSINSNLWGTLKPYNVEVESGAPDPDISENYKRVKINSYLTTARNRWGRVQEYQSIFYLYNLQMPPRSNN